MKPGYKFTLYEVYLVLVTAQKVVVFFTQG